MKSTKKVVNKKWIYESSIQVNKNAVQGSHVFKMLHFTKSSQELSLTDDMYDCFRTEFSDFARNQKKGRSWRILWPEKLAG